MVYTPLFHACSCFRLFISEDPTIRRKEMHENDMKLYREPNMKDHRIPKARIRRSKAPLL